MPFHITYYKPVKSASYFSNISATQIYDSPILKRNFSTLNVNPLKTTRILTQDMKSLVMIITAVIFFFFAKIITAVIFIFFCQDHKSC
jgi:hypothetical protein